MQRFLVGSCVALFVAAVFAADNPEDSAIVVYNVFPEHERPALIASYKKELASVTMDLETARKAARSRYKEKKATALDEIDRLQPRLEILRKNDPPYIGVSIDRWKSAEWDIDRNIDVVWAPGAIGAYKDEIFVDKILDDETAIFWIREGKYQRGFIGKGWKTSLWRHDASFELHEPIWVTGTIVLDGRTYSLVEPFDWAKYKAQNAELPKRK